jgi:HPt (histidine-containing phosphotransfer) domain-containing protein
MMPGKPDLSGFSARLAADNIKVQHFLTVLESDIDRIIAIVETQDWTELRRITSEMALNADNCGYSSMAKIARQIYDAADRPGNERGIRRAVMRLIGACGRNQPAESAAPAPA